MYNEKLALLLQTTNDCSATGSAWAGFQLRVACITCWIYLFLANGKQVWPPSPVSFSAPSLRLTVSIHKCFEVVHSLCNPFLIPYFSLTWKSSQTGWIIWKQHFHRHISMTLAKSALQNSWVISCNFGLILRCLSTFRASSLQCVLGAKVCIQISQCHFHTFLSVGTLVLLNVIKIASKHRLLTI